jgi:hypothetical protein
VRVAFSWHPGREAASAQRVDVAFAPMRGGTRVTLTHDGWAVLGEHAGDTRRNYETGWAFVLGDRYVRHCESAR